MSFSQNEFKAELPCIGNCMVIGDKRKFLTILIALRSEVRTTLVARTQTGSLLVSQDRVGSCQRLDGSSCQRPSLLVCNLIGELVRSIPSPSFLFVSAQLRQVDADGIPTSKLTGDSLMACEKIGSTATTIEEAKEDPKVLKPLVSAVLGRVAHPQVEGPSRRNWSSVFVFGRLVIFAGVYLKRWMTCMPQVDALLGWVRDTGLSNSSVLGCLSATMS